MSRRQEFRLKIDAYSPETIPMVRLAEYMSDLATVLGSRDSVHFVRLDAGSTILVQEVEFEAVPKVRARLDGIRARSAPEDAIQAYASLDRRLAEDNATGVLVTDNSEVIEFPGRNRPQEGAYGLITQMGTVDGVLIRVGGRDRTVPVHLQEGATIHKCNASREMAKKLAPHLYGETLRVKGVGKWRRDDFGNWTMEWFTITAFDLLKDSTIGEAVAGLRATPGGLQVHEDIIGELNRIRHGQNKTQ